MQRRDLRNVFLAARSKIRHINIAFAKALPHRGDLLELDSTHEFAANSAQPAKG